MSDVIRGFFFLKRGLASIKKYPGLKWFILIPLFIDFVLVTSFFTVGVQMISGWVASALAFVETGGWFFSIIYYPLFILAWVVYGVLALYLVFAISSVVASPFNAFMAEKILKQNGLIKDDKFSFLSWAALTLKMLLTSLVKAVVFALLGICIFIVSFIPGLNLASSFGIFLIFAFDSFDYAFEVRGWKLSERMNYFKRNFPSAVGMATMFALTIFIPGLTILVLPLAVVGATDLMCELES